MGFLTAGVFGGALVGAAMGGYNSNGQGPMGTLGDIGAGAIKGAVIGGALGAGARMGTRAWAKHGPSITSKMLGRTNKAVESTVEKVRQVSPSRTPKGMPGRLDIGTMDRMEQLNYDRMKAASPRGVMAAGLRGFPLSGANVDNSIAAGSLSRGQRAMNVKIAGRNGNLSSYSPISTRLKPPPTYTAGNGGWGYPGESPIPLVNMKPSRTGVTAIPPTHINGIYSSPVYQPGLVGRGHGGGKPVRSGVNVARQKGFLRTLPEFANTILR